MRHWTYTKDDSGHTAQMTNGNIDCVCPAGWEGAECAQCSAGRRSATCNVLEFVTRAVDFLILSSEGSYYY